LPQVVIHPRNFTKKRIAGTHPQPQSQPSLLDKNAYDNLQTKKMSNKNKMEEEGPELGGNDSFTETIQQKKLDTSSRSQNVDFNSAKKADNKMIEEVCGAGPNPTALNFQNSSLRKNQKRFDMTQIAKVIDIEDIISKDEPKFPDLTSTHKLMTIQKLQYLEKWLELSFLEEREKNRSENSDAAQKSKFQTQGYFIPNSDLQKKKFEFDLESYEELSLALNNLPQNFNHNPSIYLKFSKSFESEKDAETL
jgi:hypothetical protein